MFKHFIREYNGSESYMDYINAKKLLRALVGTTYCNNSHTSLIKKYNEDACEPSKVFCFEYHQIIMFA